MSRASQTLGRHPCLLVCYGIMVLHSSASSCLTSRCAVKDTGAQLIAEKWLPGHDGIGAELKVYDTSPHVMDPLDPRLTSLGSKIGEPCSALLCCLPEEQ